MRLRACALAAVCLVAPAVAAAQDIEMRASMSRRTLPEAYYERLARDPAAFDLRDGWRQRAAIAAALQSAVQGTLPIAVIPTLFSGSVAPPAVVSPAAMQLKLFDGPETSSITGLFSEMSRGALQMRGTVGSWVPTSLDIRDVVGTNYGLGAGSRVGDWLMQAVAAADAQFDFRQFDSDGADGIPDSGDDDGRVDGAAFLFHEVDAACGGPGIWPHRSRVSGWGKGPAVTRDIGRNGQPILIDDYIILGAMDCTGTRPLESNVFGHEMGHVLGLPDYYDASGGLLREQRRWVVGCWELMSGGSWGCGTGPQPAMRPPHMGPHPKTLLNWVSPTPVPAEVRNQEYVLRPVRISGDVLRVALTPREHLLLEYRDRGGFDAGLPAAGVLAYRVETNRNFLPCATCPRTYSYSLLEADGNGALVRPETAGGNRGEAGDAYRSGAITGGTLPSTVTNDGSLSTVSIHSIIIDAAANVARVVITTAAAPQIASAAAAGRRFAPMNAEVRGNGGAEPYVFTVQGALPGGVTWTGQRDRLVFTGVPTAAGTFPVTVTLRDQRGTTVQQALTLSVAAPPVIAATRLVAALSDGGAMLSADERGYLDEQGNRNGRFDIGDARAYLRRNP